MLRFYTVYNSMRYIREKLYLRLRMEPTPGLLALLNSEFQDILVTGIIETVPPHPMEANDAHLADLYRISLHFNRRAFGRLRQMIDFINAELMDQDAVRSVAAEWNWPSSESPSPLSSRRNVPCSRRSSLAHSEIGAPPPGGGPAEKPAGIRTAHGVWER